MSCPRCCAAFAAVLVLLASASCSDAPVMSSATAPRPGVAVVSLDAGALSAGAVLIELQGRGEGMGAPAGVDAARPVFVRQLDERAATYLVAIAGERVNGALFAFAVPDVNRLDRYTVTLMQVADETNRVQTDLSGYRLSVDGRAPDGATGGTIYN